MAKASRTSKKEERAKAAAQLKAKALRTQAAALNAQARALSREAGAGLAEGAAELAERASELAERLRASDAYERALERGGELATSARERGMMAAHAAREKLAEAGVDAKLAELAETLRDSESVTEAREKTRAMTGTALAGLGAWLGSGSLGKQMGLERRRRRWPGWLLAGVGVGAGYAVGVLTAPKRPATPRDDWTAAATASADAVSLATSRAAQETADTAAPPAEKPLADRIRTTLGEDPRTSGLPRLNINVVEGTVFVRGTVPEDVDPDAIKQVIAGVEGVKDVDLQVTAG